MKVRFIGAAGRVTGSCTQLSYERTGVQFLVDCGMVQGEGNDAAINSEPWPFNPADLKFVLLTHAHLDHCGLIPRLYRDGFKGKVICTRFTAELAHYNLLDATRQNGCPYTAADVVKNVAFDIIDDRNDFGLSRRVPIADDLFVSFLRSAHIGGACSITISWKRSDADWAEIHFSGDVGNNIKGNSYQSLLAHRQTPFAYPAYFVLESTYGDRCRDPSFACRERRITELAQIVREALYVRGGPLVIPCFSIHRTQELLLDLHLVLENVLSVEASRDFDGEPLFSCEEHIDSALANGLRLGHVEGRKSLIAHWPPDVQQEWLSWFVRSGEAGNNGPKPVLLPSDDNPETLLQARTRLRRLRKRKNPCPTIIMDSPLALKMTGVYRAELKRRQRRKPEETIYRNRALVELLGCSSESEVDHLLDRLFLDGDGVSVFNTYNLMVETNRQKSSESIGKANTIVLTGGGMCEGGPVVSHLQAVLENEAATILLTGYAPSQSLAGKLRSLSVMRDEHRQTEYLDVGRTRLSYSSIKATICDIGPYYSGHADQGGLVDYLMSVTADPETAPADTRVFLNHGDDRKRQGLANAIRERTIAVPQTGARAIRGIEIPDSSLRWFDLNNDAWIDLEQTKVDDTPDLSVLGQLLQEQRTTNLLLQQLLNLQTDRGDQMQRSGEVRKGKWSAKSVGKKRRY
jgi:metallo-beta-lactamase family protein